MYTSRGPTWPAVIIVALVLGLAGGGLGAWLVLNWLGAALVPGDIHSPLPPRLEEVTVRTEQDAIVRAVAKASPAVVTIITLARAQPTSPFGMPFGPTEPRQGVGSGFLFDYEGRRLILTNTHVVAEADELMVRTSAGQEFRARKLGLTSADLAVIEPVDPPADLPFLPLGDDTELPVGAWVIAVGSPFGIENTVTVGVVSRKGLVPVGPNESRYLIQTDAAINRGNSGGPLLDLGGNVIGVNQMIFSPTQTNLGIGWAIPISEARELMYFLVHRGPWVGVTTSPNSPGLARQFNLSTEQGAVIAGVMRGSPADRAGLKPLDVILKIAGADIQDHDDVRQAILKHRIGDTIEFVVQRGRETLTLTVEAGTVPEN